MKNNKFYKLCYFLLIFLIIMIPTFLIIHDDINNKKIINYQKEYQPICKNLEENKEPCFDVINKTCDTYLKDTENKEIIKSQMKDYCQNIFPYDDGFMYSHTLVVGQYFNTLVIVVIFILILFSSIYITNVLIHKTFYNKLTRTNYKSIIKDVLLKSYSYIWILPSIVLISLIIQIFYFGYDNTINLVNINNTYWNEFLVKNPSIFIILYLLNITIFTAGIINLSLITARFSKKYIYSVLMSFLILIIIQIIFELLPFINSNVISLISFLRFNTSLGISIPLIVSILFYMVTLTIFILVYKNKENLVKCFDE